MILSSDTCRGLDSPIGSILLNTLSIDSSFQILLLINIGYIFLSGQEQYWYW